ncbi:MAG TPA: hypothetical protein PKZ07_06820 [Sedimentisphaerales bacterium]|nr:hypothetical protein [Sedimentisphaerales bacterium]HOV50903.1 hypothetical protein [Candidatus Cryosericum sp.]
MQFEDRKSIDAVKGILILFVVLGHSVLATEFAALKTFIYSFHVYAFLLLPFILSQKVATRENLLNVATRYLVPYVAVVLLMSIPYGLLRGYSGGQWFGFYVRGIATGNDNYLKATSGQLLFWFLPVVAWINVLLQMYNWMGFAGRTVLCLLFIVGHLALPAMPWEQKQHYPYLGTHIAVYIMPVGLLLRHLCLKMSLAFCKRLRVLWLLGFDLSVLWMFWEGSSLSLAHLGCPSYKTALLVVVHALIPLSAVLALIGFSQDLSKVPYLARFGQKSMSIYLFSQPVVVGSTSFVRDYIALDGHPGLLLCGSISVVSGIVFGCTVAYVIDAVPTLRALLFPRSYRELCNVVRDCARRLMCVPPSRF